MNNINEKRILYTTKHENLKRQNVRKTFAVRDLMKHMEKKHVNEAEVSRFSCRLNLPPGSITSRADPQKPTFTFCYG